MRYFKSQFKFVLMAECVLVLLACSVAFVFWTSVCDQSWDSCLVQGNLKPGNFLLLALIRPLLFTPLMVMAWIGGESFGLFGGALLSALGAVLSCALLYFPAKYIGSSYAKPWLSSNLPSTYRLIRTQDYKVVFFARMMPFVPFDLMSLIFGATDFRWRSVMLASFLGILPEAFIFASFTSNPEFTGIGQALWMLMVLSLVTMIPLLVYEIIYRRRGTSMWMRLKNAYREIVLELHVNNDIRKRHDYDPSKTPVILLYGFFSSRRSLLVMERLLTSRGFQVMSFNLGGLFGVFFTRGIEDTARFIDMKIDRQIQRHGFKKFHVVGHSKGGLVALYWLTKLGGHRYCDRLVTMGTPFKGTMLTYIALLTPVGFFWPDVWQMRPGSHFLQDLHQVVLPKNLQLHCLHSIKDRVCRGENGVFQPLHKGGEVVSVPMNHVSHFEFLYRRDVGDTISSILLADKNEISAHQAVL